MNLREEGWGGMDLINLAQDSDQWWAYVTTVMNVGLHKMLEISWVDEQRLAP
jgi:hypothetical protein